MEGIVPFLGWFAQMFMANQNSEQSAEAQKQANETYLTGVRETNEQNYKIWQEEKQHNIDMFNMENEASIANWQNQFDKTNAYNSPLAQRQRLEQAGLNPSMMMSNGSTGVASSSGIPQARVNPTHVPTMQAPNQVTPSGVVKAQQQMASMLSFAQSLSATSDANLKGVTAEGADNLNKINKKYGDFMAFLSMRDAEENVKQKEQQNYLNKQIQDDIIATYRAQRALSELKVEDAKIINKYLDENQQLSLAKLSAEVGFVLAQTDMTKAQEQKLIADRFYVWKMANLTQSQIDLNNQLYNFNDKTEKYAAHVMKEEAYQSTHNTALKSYEVSYLESTFLNMVESQIGSYKLSSLESDLDYQITDKYRWSRMMNYNTKWLKGWGSTGK